MKLASPYANIEDTFCKGIIVVNKFCYIIVDLKWLVDIILVAVMNIKTSCTTQQVLLPGQH